MNTSQLTITQLASTINAHLGKANKYADKAEEHFKSMGIHLIEAKQRIASGEYEGGFVAFLAAECKGLSKSRAYELIAIGNGTKTVADGRKVKAAGMQKARLAIRHVVDSEGEIPSIETPTEFQKQIADAQAALAAMPALDALQRERAQSLGATLLKAYKKNPKGFDTWKDGLGMADMSTEQARSFMFYGQHAETLEELRFQLQYPLTAQSAYIAASDSIGVDIDPMMMAEIDYEIDADAKIPQSPEKKVFLEIIEQCQGKTLEQLNRILKAVSRN